MFLSQHSPTAPHTRAAPAAVFGAVVALMAVLGGCSQQDASAGARSGTTRPAAHPSPERGRDGASLHPPGERPGRLPDEPPGPAHGASGVADGQLPDGVEPFEDGYPALTRLDPALLEALREAARAAGRDDVTIYVNSGWRSSAYQQQLLDEAETRYGARDDAARWVASVDTSPHVSGDAVDVGDADATAWLSEHGAAYGLCQVYANESWHYELRPDASASGCPAGYADPSHDPRMQP